MVETMVYTGTLVVQECCSCGVRFAIPEGLNKRALQERGSTGTVFFCPLGHRQWYIGETDAEKEKRRRLDAEARATAIRDQLEAEKRSHAATKGAHTKTKRRVARGVCPCCNRTFANVHRHMESQHPEYAS